MKRDGTRGFTLIELLIVVAIIAVLAAIAVPNLLEAQVRAKVARVKSDLRTIAMALEAYRADNNAYPPNDPLRYYATIGWHEVPPFQITTPVAYLPTSVLIDPFGQRRMFYTYNKIVTFRELFEDSNNGFFAPVEAIDMPGFNFGAHEKYGEWRLVSNGPDRSYIVWDLSPVDPVLQGSDLAYDPTNGTVSWGNILRTQKSTLAEFTE